MQNIIATPLLLAFLSSLAAAAPQEVESSGAFLHYGRIAPGTQSVNGPRLVMTGLPTPGGYVTVQLHGFSPLAIVDLNVGSAPTNVVLPNGKRRLVSLQGATHQFVQVDAGGYASFHLPIPGSTPLETDFYIQGFERAPQGAPAVVSNAAELHVAGKVRETTQMSLLSGTAKAGGMTLAQASGVLTATSYARSGELQSISTMLEARDFSYAGVTYSDLRISPSRLTQTVVALGNGAFRVKESLDVTFSPQGQSEIFVQVPAIIHTDAYKTTAVLDPLPLSIGNLGGLALTFEVGHVDHDCSYFEDSLQQHLLVDGFDVNNLTDQDAEYALQVAYNRMQLAFADWDSADAYFDPTVPTYFDLVQRENAVIDRLTGGAAQDRAGILALVGSGTMSTSLGAETILLGKIMSILDLDEEYEAVRDVLKDQAGDDIKKFKKHLKNRKLKKAYKAMKKIINAMGKKKFIKELKTRLGDQVGERVAKKIGKRVTPGLGQLTLIWGLVSTVGRQIADLL